MERVYHTKDHVQRVKRTTLFGDRNLEVIECEVPGIGKGHEYAILGFADFEDAYVGNPDLEREPRVGKCIVALLVQALGHPFYNGDIPDGMITTPISRIEESVEEAA